VPDRWNARIAIHLRALRWCIVVAATAIATSVYVWRYHRERLGLAQTSLLISAFIVFQVTHSARSY
jgi:hypothetical protein